VLVRGAVETVVFGADDAGGAFFGHRELGLENETFGEPPAVSRILARYGYDLVYPAKAG
jgi:hypothetical protein